MGKISSKNQEAVAEKVDAAIANLSDLAQYLTLVLENSVLKDKDIDKTRGPG